jgi:hypothetical protein
MNLTYDEIMFLLNLIAEKHGVGYSEDEKVSKIQHNLSIWLQVQGAKEGKTIPK